MKNTASRSTPNNHKPRSSHEAQRNAGKTDDRHIASRIPCGLLAIGMSATEVTEWARWLLNQWV
jgi:hypothetical protein